MIETWNHIGWLSVFKYILNQLIFQYLFYILYPNAGKSHPVDDYKRTLTATVHAARYS